MKAMENALNLLKKEKQQTMDAILGKKIGAAVPML
jgi:hypothetical protein